MTQALTRRSTALVAPQLDYFLVDGSGSMKGKWWDCLAAMDGFFSTLRSANIASHGVVSVFDDTNLQSIQRDSAISEWKTFNEDPIGATWGGTPLYDAVCAMGHHLRQLDPEVASIVIVTDGRETLSRCSLEQARAVLDWCRGKGWQVTFLGADFDNTETCRRLGGTRENCLGITQAKLADAGKLLADKRVRHARSGGDIGFTSDEQSTFGGYLTGGK